MVDINGELLLLVRLERQASDYSLNATQPWQLFL